MVWTYVLKYNNDHIYIGSSPYLDSTFIINDFTKYINEEYDFILVGLYNTSNNVTFIEYDKYINQKYTDYDPCLLYDWSNNNNQYYCENNLAEIFMNHKKYDRSKITGGKYINNTNDTNTNNKLIQNIKKIYGKIFKKFNNHRPFCNCGYPCEVIKKYKNIYFICPMKKAFHTILTNIQIESTCNFYQKYTNDTNKKKKYLAYKSLYYDYTIEPWVNNLPISNDTCNLCIKCNKFKYDLVYAHNKIRSVCKQCFMKQFIELKKMHKL